MKNLVPKLLILLIAVIFSFKSFGQYYSEQKTADYYDTVKVWITVIDTAKETKSAVTYKNSTWTGVAFTQLVIYGYAVYLHKWIPEQMEGDAMYMGEMARGLFQYLDDKKKKLPKNFVVIN